jgi:hypothetical protein
MTSGRFLDRLDDSIRAGGLGRIDGGMLIKPCLPADQLNGKKPIDFLPRCRHLGSDRLTEDLAHRLEQVMADHDVLLGADP